MILCETLLPLPVAPGTWEASQGVMKVAFILVPVFMLIDLGTSTIRYFMGKDEIHIHYERFLTTILLWHLLVFYQPVMQMINATVNLVINAVDSVAEEPIKAVLISTKYLELGGEDYLKQSAPLSPPSTSDRMNAPVIGLPKPETDGKKFNIKAPPPPGASMSSFLGNLTSAYGVKGMANKLLGLILETFVDGLTLVIRLLLEAMAYLLTQVLIIIGPLAIAFEVLPGVGRGALMRWFTYWLGVKCWLLTMSILDLAIEKVGDALFNATNAEAALWGQPTLIIQSTMVIAYIMVPFLTKLYISNDSGGLNSTAIRGGQMVVQAGKAVVTKGKSLIT